MKNERRWFKLELYVQRQDILTSQKGFLVEDPISMKKYVVTKLKPLWKDVVRILDEDKKEIKVKEA